MLPVSIQDSTLEVSFPYCTFLTAQDSASLVSGEEIAVVCRLELWQKRKLWFDRLRQTAINYYTLSYDRWDEKFQVFYHDREGWEVTESFTVLDSLCEYLTRQGSFDLPLSTEDYQRESFIAYAIHIEYLTLEQLSEIRSWLHSGNSRSGDQNSFPDKVLGFLLKSSGLKNRSDLRSSEDFYPARIQGQIKF